MRSIFTLILFVIGMITFTATASTTAKLEQKQKVERVTELTTQIIELQVVDIYKNINLPQVEVAVEVKTLNLAKNETAETFYSASKDVGWRSSQIILYHTQKEKIAAILNLKTCNDNKTSLRYS
jgi:hypothetical protein